LKFRASITRQAVAQVLGSGFAYQPKGTIARRSA
jgi:glycosyltransferase A (GT-A) superfamily protein (DUF2064 family)